MKKNYQDLKKHLKKSVYLIQFLDWYLLSAIWFKLWVKKRKIPDAFVNTALEFITLVQRFAPEV